MCTLCTGSGYRCTPIPVMYQLSVLPLFSKVHVAPLISYTHSPLTETSISIIVKVCILREDNGLLITNVCLLSGCRLLLLLRWTSFICISLLVCFTLYALTVGTDDGLRRFEWIQTKNISEYVFPNKVTTVLDQPDFCHDDVQLLIIVCSAPKNLQAREAIRETWGGEATRNSDTKLVFFLGQSDNGSYKVRNISMIGLKIEYYYVKTH